MTTFQVLTVVASTVLICFLIALVVYMYGTALLPRRQAVKGGPFSFSSEAPLKNIGGSEIRKACDPSPTQPLSSGEPFFKTLRLKTDKIGPAKWRFKIELLFINNRKETIGLYDMHTRVYEKFVPTPGYATISYRGEVLLTQDNTANQYRVMN